MRAHSRTIAAFALASTTLFGACDDDPTDPEGNETELITAVEITLVPVSGAGATIVSTIEDPDGNGPLAPLAQDTPIQLQPGVTYNGSMRFLDAQDPTDVENITLEVLEEDDEHRVFYTVAGIGGVSVPDSSLDLDRNGAPLGVTFQVVVDAGASGAGTLQVLLSHFDDEPKGDGATPSDETDADVTYDFTVS
jgi:hypothetical protein